MELVRLSARANDLFMAASPWRATRPQPFFFFFRLFNGGRNRPPRPIKTPNTHLKQSSEPPKKKKQKQILIAYSEIKNKKTIMKRLEYHLI